MGMGPQSFLFSFFANKTARNTLTHTHTHTHLELASGSHNGTIMYKHTGGPTNAFGIYYITTCNIIIIEKVHI